jgi:hypothetical protein
MVIANKLLLSSNFGTAIPYINERFSIGKIEGIIAKLLQEEKITVEQYTKFVDSAAMLEGFSRIVSVSSTPKGMLPPPNIAKLKAEIEAEMVEKYGPNWVKIKTCIVEYEEKLRALKRLVIQTCCTGPRLLQATCRARQLAILHSLTEG